MTNQTSAVLVPQAADPTSLRASFAQFPTGVAAISAVPPGKDPAVFIASSFQVGISLEPALVLFAVQHSSASWPRLREFAQSPGARLGVSVLAHSHDGAVRKLASKSLSGAERFEGISTTTLDSGAHFLDGSPVWMTTSVYGVVPAGDHDVVLLEVHELAHDESVEPLLWHASGFRNLVAR